MSVFKDFLHNLFYILTPIFLYVTLWSGFGFQRNRKLTKLFFFALCISSMALSMTFPVVLNNGVTFDLRHIPLVIGTIYGGAWMGAALLVFQLSYRVVLVGTEAVFFAIYFSTLVYLVYLVFSKHYHAFSLKKKIWSFNLVLLAIVTTTIAFPSTIFADSRSEIAFYMVQFFAIYVPVFFLVIYTLEKILLNDRLKKDLRKSEQLRLVSELAASVAHEVRNPMTVARGFIQLLHSNANLTENEKKYMQLTMSEIDRAQMIISDYLSLAKPKDAKLQTINVAFTLDKVRHTIQAYALMNNVSVFLDVPSNLKIKGDESELTQVVLNLGKNGIEAMPRGGKLFLSAVHTGQHIRIKIADTGSGMTKEEVQQLGNAYYSTKEKGTGLGLMVSFSIIRSWGGHIQVNSKLGEGTEFVIQLPVVSASKDETKTKEPVMS
ncbi:sensor histidine kinase [Alteribacter aurantiacus]|uniref:ATP-binding protein n=1 Tax=Alteribacter aurantiacus TaxID=254410 RepID=UPI00041FCE54|nr:sensor histidine kinase [Alteribacter aurantiacus]